MSKNVSSPVLKVETGQGGEALTDLDFTFLGRDFSRQFMLRINGADIKGTLARLETLWKERIPDNPFRYHFLDEDFDRLYVSEQRSSLLFGIAAGLAVILACLGLFGLAAFTTMQRTKEIGIRRVLGATVSGITLLISKNFLQLIGLAIVIAAPLAWWAGNKWLQDFAFRIPVSISVFVVTALVTVVIALCTIGYHTIKASLANPVESLRTE